MATSNGKLTIDPASLISHGRNVRYVQTTFEGAPCVVLVVDSSQDHGESTSGKTRTIAATGAAMKLSDDDGVFSVGVNAYRKPTA